MCMHFNNLFDRNNSCTWLWVCDVDNAGTWDKDGEKNNGDIPSANAENPLQQQHLTSNGSIFCIVAFLHFSGNWLFLMVRFVPYVPKLLESKIFRDTPFCINWKNFGKFVIPHVCLLAEVNNRHIRLYINFCNDNNTFRFVVENKVIELRPILVQGTPTIIRRKMLCECWRKVDGLLNFPFVNTFYQDAKTIHNIKGSP